jgi:hypothetical protein
MMFKLAMLALVTVALSSVSAPSAQANVTHAGKIDIDLQLVDSNGSMSKIDSKTADYALDWNAATYQVNVRDLTVTGKLDRSRDLNDSRGNLLVHENPTNHFDGQSLDAIINQFGQNDHRTKDMITRIVNDTSASRVSGFDLPTYTCEKCLPAANGKVPTWNAYESFVTRSIEINHPSLRGKKLVLRMKLYRMKADGHAFNIIGNNDAGNFGNH